MFDMCENTARQTTTIDHRGHSSELKTLHGIRKTFLVASCVEISILLNTHMSETRSSQYEKELIELDDVSTRITGSQGQGPRLFSHDDDNDDDVYSNS